MGVAQVPNVHLEAVEEAQNEGCQLEKAGHPGRQGLPVGKFQTGVLAYRRESYTKGTVKIYAQKCLQSSAE